MLLKSVKLENIRSYSSARIEFPTGSTLLAGDIGSGKSTILLSIEFALFGIKPGELVGGALLRHGCKEGSVELTLSIKGKSVVVRRGLKRIKDRIGQSSGYLIVDGVKEELMPKEIRARVFLLLDYPATLVGKGQDLIYRFTVYTPQEQMKRIIYEDKDSRLDTLRKVFNIDKYKQIRENVLVYVKALKEKRLVLEGQIKDLDEKKKQKKEIDEKVIELTSLERDSSVGLKEAKEKTMLALTKKNSLNFIVKEQAEIRKRIALLEQDLRNVISKRERDKKEIDEINSKVSVLRKELVDFREGVSYMEELTVKEKDRIKLQEELVVLRRNKAEIDGKMKHMKEASDKIIELDSCSLCLQKVPHSHKEKISLKSKDEINGLKERFALYFTKEEGLKEKEIFLEKEIKELTEKISKNKILKIKLEQLKEYENKLKLVSEEFSSSKDRVGSINKEKLLLSKKIDLEIDSKFSLAEKEYNLQLGYERKVELSYNSIVKEKEGILKQGEVLGSEIIVKEKASLSLKKISDISSWLSSRFIKLVNNIEKHVMISVYHEFNSLFVEWFSSLIEDSEISVNLDDSFSVSVVQNGYESTVDNLSGGEKTSVALAYRLALNRVINDVVTSIDTKDLLILDEPTEGFSSDQLDRVRDVLNELAVRQVIIVSHESKIESFVDNVIRISKREGESLIESN